MYRLYFSVIWLCFVLLSCSNDSNLSEMVTPFEASDSTQTATYEETISWWRALEQNSPYVCMKEFGQTDAGLPLHVVLINTSRNFNFESIKKSGKTIWLINNGIHPGEPDGIDASMLYARNILGNERFESDFKDILIMIIPMYNVGGALNRNCCSRANQNGPEYYGFRGNARNLDLNRDFSKADSKNAQSFIELFARWNPDVYLETHVSNGADYPYTMTYLLSHPDKLSPPLAAYVKGNLEPTLLEKMLSRNDEMIPYVNVFGTSPDSGYNSFYDTPRYSTGFTALHNSIGLLTETHMLKPFKQRVASTLNFLNSLGETLSKDADIIQNKRAEADEVLSAQKEFALDWEIDQNKPQTLNFKGYRAYYDTSIVTGDLQLYYDRDSRWEKEMPYYAHLKPTISVSAPSYYLVPAAWTEVVERLQLNRVEMLRLNEDTSFTVSCYRIADYKTSAGPFESHYYHYDVKLEPFENVVHCLKNSYYLVSMDQPKKRLIIEMLEPQGPDSYFNWNFYDEILQQKEGFSSYVFDREASELLKDEKLSNALAAYVASDPEKRNNKRAKLNFIYANSSHYERNRHLIYPVYRIE